MQRPEAKSGVGYYFALPRLLARSAGHSGGRTEQNWLEANVVGTFVHAIAFIFAGRLLLADCSLWQQVLLLGPLALLVCASWSLFFYLNSLVLKLLRAAGLMRDLPDNRGQSVIVGITTTLLALQLAETGSWTRVAGWIWIIAVALNLVAAAVLALLHADAAE